ncbi:hypothetical protein [Micromonospora sp. NBC_01813]|uniref:hypothetical protein n=1 Tax=Micromonospora sp. NBC_01813 TaxID=2975988 RepID=UPI002DDC3BF5|nr:hypothetical protein [Micromonospora sp. NBC_01813]WSA11531.1 hypothetical protein OG958_12535 [Micromonospora sp. NBC_01813]
MSPFQSLSLEDVEVALRTLAELHNDPFANLSARQVQVADRVAGLCHKKATCEHPVDLFAPRCTTPGCHNYAGGHLGSGA